MKYLKKYEEHNYNNKLNEILELIKDQPIINDLRKCKAEYSKWKNGMEYENLNLLPQHTMLSGKDYKDYKVINHRLRYGPKDTIRQIHDYVGKEFEEVHNWNPRMDAIFIHNGNLVIEEEPMYSRFDQNGLIFPIGDYKLIWNQQVHGLWDYLYQSYRIFRLSNWDEMWMPFPTLNPDGSVPDQTPKENNHFYTELDEMAKEDRKKQVKEMYDDLSNYVRSCEVGNLCEWFRYDVEGMMKAEKYVVIDMRYENDIQKYIWG